MLCRTSQREEPIGSENTARSVEHLLQQVDDGIQLIDSVLQKIESSGCLNDAHLTVVGTAIDSLVAAFEELLEVSGANQATVPLSNAITDSVRLAAEVASSPVLAKDSETKSNAQ